MLDGYNYRYSAEGDLEIDVGLTLKKWYLQDHIRNHVNQTGNQYYVRCGNVIVNVRFYLDVASAILAVMLSQGMEFSLMNISHELCSNEEANFQSIHNSERSIVLQLLPTVWVSNDKKAIEQVELKQEVKKAEQLFKLIIGLE